MNDNMYLGEEHSQRSRWHFSPRPEQKIGTIDYQWKVQDRFESLKQRNDERKIEPLAL